jgi:hypothetical protein
MRSVILLGSTVASCGIAAAIPGASRIVSEIGFGLVSGADVTAPSILEAVVVVVLLMGGAVAAITFET